MADKKRWVSCHDFPRQEILEGVKQVVAFLESHPECDIPESMGEFWIRTLVRQNRGELKTKVEVTQWALRQMKALQPVDEKFSGEHFIAIKKFSGGVILKLYVGTYEVCEISTEKRTVEQPIEIEESTWHVPEELIALGFSLSKEKQDELRARERSVSNMFLRQQNLSR